MIGHPYPSGPKSGWLAQANAIASGATAVQPADTPVLLEWLKDMNWPGAIEIAEYLRSCEFGLVEPIRHVLASGDSIWIRWVLLSFCDSFGFDFWGRLKDDLVRIAFNWDEDGAHIEALYVLARLRLVDEGLIAQELRMMKLKPKANAVDYERVAALLSGETA
jgi:hypothetical protein